jgi:hypothetical protein
MNDGCGYCRNLSHIDPDRGSSAGNVHVIYILAHRPGDDTLSNGYRYMQLIEL